MRDDEASYWVRNAGLATLDVEATGFVATVKVVGSLYKLSQFEKRKMIIKYEPDDSF